MLMCESKRVREKAAGRDRFTKLEMRFRRSSDDVDISVQQM